jgi:hypothetical protein
VDKVVKSLIKWSRGIKNSIINANQGLSQYLIPIDLLKIK